MAKAAAIQHACSECGYTTGKWLGKCPTSGSWGTLVEERVAAAPKGAAAGSRYNEHQMATLDSERAAATA